MRVSIRVRPGARRAAVGGRWGDAVVVAVREPAVNGRATEAALAAVAEAFGVRRATVRLVAGASSRTKVVEIDPEPAGGQATLERLLGPTG